MFWGEEASRNVMRAEGWARGMKNERQDEKEWEDATDEESKWGLLKSAGWEATQRE